MGKDFFGKTSCAGHLLGGVLLERAVDNVNVFKKLLNRAEFSKRNKGPGIMKVFRSFGFLPILLILAGMALGLLPGCGSQEPPVPQKPGGLQPGDRAYDFSLMSSTGQLVKMSDLKPGWYLVLVLYRGQWC